ncbi:DNA-packaging protein [Pseudomonas sp. MAFF 311095]|uniref:DNA-packaging protein n=1 Tax=Pseudomonas petroselini TaxID=2899822 RepID=UPI001E5AE4BC|nr:DNA-packaging protein [Pseudomonas petroselini]MCD7046659.1 DNA-packaging protein [Pseudomonas petroselini]MCD7068824.1 DNA-packaging protein [Pseudomonas petroselini]MCD7079229.1 DNA-packaging protein [Pseudomonas petroselini]
MKSLFLKSLPILAILFVLGMAIKVLDDFGQSRYDAGYALAKSEGDRALAKAEQARAEEKQSAAETATSAAQQANAELLKEQARNDQLAVQLSDTKENLRKTTDRLKGDIARVTTLYRRALDAKPEPLPIAVFTTGFVRVWNTANGITATPPVQTPNSSGRTPAPASGTGTTDDLDSGVTQEQLLTNQVRNAELHGVCRAQLTSLINWTRNESK